MKLCNILFRETIGSLSSGPSSGLQQAYCITLARSLPKSSLMQLQLALDSRGYVLATAELALREAVTLLHRDNLHHLPSKLAGTQKREEEYLSSHIPQR